MTPGQARKDALTVALNYLSSRPRSIFEVRTKLKDKGFEAAEIDKTVSRLIEASYLDDEKFAAILVESRLRFKNWGPAKIARDLDKKGIPTETIARLLSGSIVASNSAAREAARKWMKKNRLSSPLERKDTERAFRFLSSRGFSPSVIFEVIREMDTDAPQAPPDEL